MGAGKGQRGCEEGKQKASATAGWCPDLDYLGTVSLSCGHWDIYTKARKATSVAILHHTLKNESISRTPLIYLYCTNQIVGIEEEQAEDYDVDVVGLGCPMRLNSPRWLIPLSFSGYVNVTSGNITSFTHRPTLCLNMSDSGTDAQRKM